MCGIVGLFSQEKLLSSSLLQKAMQSLLHRGPDSQNSWVSPSQKVALGHTRLSIIDLSTGQQPLSNENGKIHAIINGEFYGFEKIRSELEEKGHTFKTHSDSEILIHLYEEYGPACLEKLRGEFAFALWDEANQLFFAARDRFGIKPLYYSNYKDTFYCASEIKAILALGVPAAWDEEAFYFTQHALGTNLQNRSLFKGIYQIPPGHYLLASPNHQQIVQYWDFDYPEAGKISSSYSEQDYIEQFRAEFEEAIKLRLRADVPVGCYLSGGLDSCSVLGFASRHSAKPIEAYTISFEKPEYDELSIAEEMARQAGANFHPITVKQQELMDSFSDAIWHTETLSLNNNCVAKFLLSKAVHQAGCKVVLTGEGSDEIFGGYPHFRKDMLLYNTQGQDPQEIKKIIQDLNSNNLISTGIMIPEGAGIDLTSVQKILGFVPSFIESSATYAAKCRSLFSQDFSERFGERDAYQYLLAGLDLNNQVFGRDPVNQSLYLWSKFALPNYMLTLLGDRMEMAHSIEGRLPFLDHKFIEFVRTLPIALKIKGMTEKYILREAAKPFITETVYKRQKHPFLAPPASLEKEGRNLFIQETLRSADFRKVPFYDQKKVIELLDKLPTLSVAQSTALDTVLMTLCSASLLQKHFHL